ncbi:MAG: enoyl-CoA hydratase/isomerase family protein [Gammaproteobacteria bacterium]|nr:enoyl-CoA hydratase/isomerase family protein [Gammaproteobacteria bacterium]
MPTFSEVLFETLPGREGDLGVITLNRPEVLNSLNHDMIKAMDGQLKIWADQPQIKAVIIRAAPGRAFCAGGDLRLTYQRFHHDDARLIEFFIDEYELNRTIFHYPKPYIALLDGITMGGGAGISIHGSHRVATERLLFAMPEVGIGFYPDVGGCYFLSRLPHFTGFYLGLTGTKIASDDCVALGIAQFKIPSEKIPTLVAMLADTPLSSEPKKIVDSIISKFQVEAGPALLAPTYPTIESAFSQQSVENIMHSLEADHENPLAQAILAEMEKKSPTSLKVTFKALMKARHQDFNAVMEQDLCLTQHFMQGHDFFEGIRSVIIDKDQRPHWQPSRLILVTDKLVDSYFQAVEDTA